MFPCRKAITSKLAVWMRFNRSLHWFTGAHCYSMLHGSGGKNNNVHQNSLDDSSTQYGPYFDMSNSKNVTTILGKTTYLNCRVKNLGNKTVSERSNTYRVNSICFFQSWIREGANGNGDRSIFKFSRDEKFLRNNTL